MSMSLDFLHQPKNSGLIFLIYSSGALGVSTSVSTSSRAKGFDLKLEKLCKKFVSRKSRLRLIQIYSVLLINSFSFFILVPV